MWTARNQSMSCADLGFKYEKERSVPSSFTIVPVEDQLYNVTNILQHKNHLPSIPLMLPKQFWHVESWLSLHLFMGPVVSSLRMWAADLLSDLFPTKHLERAWLNWEIRRYVWTPQTLRSRFTQNCFFVSPKALLLVHHLSHHGPFSNTAHQQHTTSQTGDSLVL